MFSTTRMQRPQTFAELLRQEPPVHRPQTPAKASTPKAASKPVNRRLTPAQSAALTDERLRLQRENCQLKRKLYVKTMALKVGSFSLAAVAASIKFPWPR